jgi:hypothetical protein
MALHCHHFLCQNVLPVEDEPTYVCCADKEVFVATACCHIEQYRVDAGQCAFIGRFPTVGVVHQMAYCVAG